MNFDIHISEPNLPLPRGVLKRGLALRYGCIGAAAAFSALFGCREQIWLIGPWLSDLPERQISIICLPFAIGYAYSIFADLRKSKTKLEWRNLFTLTIMVSVLLGLIGIGFLTGSPIIVGLLGVVLLPVIPAGFLFVLFNDFKRLSRQKRAEIKNA